MHLKPSALKRASISLKPVANSSKKKGKFIGEVWPASSVSLWRKSKKSVKTSMASNSPSPTITARSILSFPGKRRGGEREFLLPFLGRLSPQHDFVSILPFILLLSIP